MKCRDCKYLSKYGNRTYLCDIKGMQEVLPLSPKCKGFKECSQGERAFRESLGLYCLKSDK